MISVFFVRFYSYIRSMESKLNELISNSGLKKKFLAEKIGITQTYLSMCLKGKRNLSKSKLNKLKELL